MAFKLPQPLHAFFSLFPLHTYPPVPYPSKTRVTSPTLWIHPPSSSSSSASSPDVGALSSDVECLKWQAYIALRGVTDIHVRWDVSPDGALGGKLPNFHVLDDEAKPKLLPCHLIPDWVDGKVGVTEGALEGYKDEAARDESRPWVSLLEGSVHAALILVQPGPSYFQTLLFPDENTTHPLQTLLNPPPAPLTGLSSIVPASGTRISQTSIEIQYREAIAALSERLGTDKWFLGSAQPTALDALAFAYIHTILNAKDTIRIEVTRRVNLVAWEWRVRNIVRPVFTTVPSS
ncbi:hypothetical protein BDN72DRAFT_830778 [Pluteus cervinus]|uniref:Uncharacterized protein n=1 Tax=Pluteus cervinus TaxID=181527 RepID=A0ACD3BEC1_9AGAR|nr:hypothetical protein BDN72DRAFT_830778 [Pluteus cervinus]